MSTPMIPVTGASDRRRAGATSQPVRGATPSAIWRASPPPGCSPAPRSPSSTPLRLCGGPGGHRHLGAGTLAPASEALVAGAGESAVLGGRIAESATHDLPRVRHLLTGPDRGDHLIGKQLYRLNVGAGDLRQKVLNTGVGQRLIVGNCLLWCGEQRHRVQLGVGMRARSVACSAARRAYGQARERRVVIAQYRFIGPSNRLAVPAEHRAFPLHIPYIEGRSGPSWAPKFDNIGVAPPPAPA